MSNMPSDLIKLIITYIDGDVVIPKHYIYNSKHGHPKWVRCKICQSANHKMYNIIIQGYTPACGYNNNLLSCHVRISEPRSS